MYKSYWKNIFDYYQFPHSFSHEYTSKLLTHIFIDMCNIGNLEMVKWLFNESIKQDKLVDINANNNEAFYSACENGHLHIVKWFIQEFNNVVNDLKKLQSDLVIKLRNKLSQPYSSYNERLSLRYDKSFIKKIYFQQININYNKDNAFRKACARGHLELAKWLFDIASTPININVKKDYAFRKACANGHLHIAKWLIDITDELEQQNRGK